MQTDKSKTMRNRWKSQTCFVAKAFDQPSKTRAVDFVLSDERPAKKGKKQGNRNEMTRPSDGKWTPVNVFRFEGKTPSSEASDHHILSDQIQGRKKKVIRQNDEVWQAWVNGFSQASAEENSQRRTLCHSFSSRKWVAWYWKYHGCKLVKLWFYHYFTRYSARYT